MPSILVDTGPLVALANRKDHWHDRCLRYLNRFRGELITTWPVLTEFSHLVSAPSALSGLQAWVQRGGLKIHALAQQDLGAMTQWMERYADRPMDLADASLVHVALTKGVTQVWTLDRNDFETYRLPNRKRFRLVEMQ